MTRNRLIGLAMCLILVTLYTNGQIKVITKEQYDAAVYPPQAKGREVPYRQRTITIDYEGGKVSESRTVITDFISSERRHLRIATTKGLITTQTESVFYDGDEYEKEGSTWRKVEKPQNRYTIQGKELPNVKQYTIEEVRGTGGVAKTYCFYTVYDLGGWLSFGSTKTSISENGRVARYEYLSSKIVPSNVDYESTTTYQYDLPDIKVERPPVGLEK